MYTHPPSENKIEHWSVSTVKKSKITGIFAINPLFALLLGEEFSGPYLMIFTFISSFLIGIVCVKRCCNTSKGFRSFAYEVR